MNFLAASCLVDDAGIAKDHAHNQPLASEYEPTGAGAKPTLSAIFDCLASNVN